MSRQWVPQKDMAYSLGKIAISDYGVRRRRIESRHSKELVAAPPSGIRLSRWNGDLSARRIRVRDGELAIEMFGTPSQTKRLHVFLSAGGGALKDGVTPQFPRVSWHPWLDGVSVNIDDPTFFAYPGQLQSGWYLGTPEQDSVVSIAAVIARIQSHYDIDNADVFIIGSSAGGTAALKVAAAVAGSTAIAENPPIYPHEQSSIKYFRRAGLDLESGVFRERNNLGYLFDHPSSQFLILQNAEDEVVVEQLGRLLDGIGLSMPRIGLNESGPVSLYVTSVPALSPHHVFLSVDDFRSVLRVAGPATTRETRAAVLDAVHEGLRARVLATDRISNLKGWARLFSALDVPALADLPLPVDSDVVRLPLRDNTEVSYRLRLGHRAKVFMALDVKPRLAAISEREVREIGASIGAKVSKGTYATTLSFAGVPLGEAAGRLARFVEATSSIFR